MSGFTLRLLFALVALVTAPVACVASGEPLHIGNFQRILDADELWVVEVMSPMCGTCQTFAPVWQAFHATHGLKVKIGQINIDTDDGMELAQDLGVLDVSVPSVWAFDKTDGQGRVIWKDDSGAVPTPDALAGLVFGAFANQRVTSDGFLGKTLEEGVGEL
jgi:thiol-disulfide isomerase/thioredoxin